MQVKVSPGQQSLPVVSEDRLGPLANVKPTPAKADLRESAYLCIVIRDALIKHYGTRKEMAYALGQVDPSLMDREFADGKLGRVDRYADAASKAAIAIAFTDAFGALSTPEARIRQTIREMRAKCDEFEQFVEQVS